MSSLHFTILALLGLFALAAAQTYRPISSPEVYQTWSRQYRPLTSSVRATFTGARFDASNNIYGVGYAQGNFEGRTSTGGRDVFTMKFGFDGTRLWVRFLGTAQDDEAGACVADFSGNVFVTGFTYGFLNGQTNAGQSDIFLAKYDPVGNLTFLLLFGTTGYEYASGIDVMSDGSVVIVGGTTGTLGAVKRSSGGNNDVFLAKYDNNGNRAWVVQYGGTNDNRPSFARSVSDYYQNSADYAGKTVAVGPFGDIYMAFAANSDIGYGIPIRGNYDVFVMRLPATPSGSTGTPVWTVGLQTPQDEYVSSLVVDTAGDVYVAGYTNQNLQNQYYAGGEDNFVAKISSSGQIVWTRLYGHASNQRIFSMTLDRAGGLYVSGYTDTPTFDGQNDISRNDCGSNMGASFMSKFDLQGNRVWTRFYTPARSPRQYQCTASYILPLATHATVNGDLIVAGNYQNLWNQVDDVTVSTNDLSYPQAFLFQLQQQNNCSLSDFDGLMSEINDLFVSLNLS